MKTTAILALLMCLLTGCHTTADVAPLTATVQQKDAEFTALAEGFDAILEYASNNGAKPDRLRDYMSFLAERKERYGRLSVAELAAVSEIGQVSLADVMRQVATVAPDVKETIDKMRGQ